MARIISWSCLLALWLAQLQCVSAEEEKSSCLKSLNSIYEAERKVRNDAVVRRYVLCENTEFYVALNFDEDGVPLDGQYPIPVGRPNIHVFCGEDGKSENNCQLVRGLVHVGVVDEFGSDTRADNVLLQGLTFFRATSVNVIAMIGGDITLQDCVFKVISRVAECRGAFYGTTLLSHIPMLSFLFFCFIPNREIEMSLPSTRFPLKRAAEGNFPSFPMMKTMASQTIFTNAPTDPCNLFRLS